HVLDEVDASARRIELVAEQHVGRAGGGAEPAMHAGPQDPFRFGDIGIGELGKTERGLHRSKAYRAAWRGIAKQRDGGAIGTAILGALLRLTNVPSPPTSAPD